MKIKQHVPGLIVATSILLVSYWLYSKDRDPIYKHDLKGVDGVIEKGSPSLNPQANAIHKKAMEQLAANNFSEAEKLFQKLINVSPNEEKSYHMLATCQVYMGKYDEAEQNFMKALEINPNYAQSYAGIGSITGHQKKYTEGIPYFKKALELQPNYALAHWGIGIAYYMDSQFELAIKHFKRTIELTPNSKYAEYSRKYLERAAVEVKKENNIN